jgi:hypothetical protein
VDGFIETHEEKLLLEQGFNAFSLAQKNSLISILAGREGLMYSEISEEYILNHHKKIKVDILSETCELEILKGFTATNGHVYRTNRDDQVNMIGQKDELNAEPSISTVHWKSEDAGYIPHTREEWLKIYVEAFAYKKTQLFKYNTLKQRVLAALTHEEIVSIGWEEPETPAEAA